MATQPGNDTRSVSTHGCEDHNGWSTTVHGRSKRDGGAWKERSDEKVKEKKGGTTHGDAWLWDAKLPRRTVDWVRKASMYGGWTQ